MSRIKRIPYVGDDPVDLLRDTANIIEYEATDVKPISMAISILMSDGSRVTRYMCCGHIEKQLLASFIQSDAISEIVNGI